MSGDDLGIQDIMATDKIGGRHYQRFKPCVGPNGEAVDVSAAAPMPVIVLSTAMLEIARASVIGFAGNNKFGRSQNLDNGVATDIWDGANPTDNQPIWLAPTAARIHTIVSTSNVDSDSGGVNPQGVGMRTIRIYYLPDWNTAEAIEDVILDGTTGVPMQNAAVIIYRMIMLTSGASGPNVGTVSATAASDNTKTAQILAGSGQTEMAVHGVPSIQTAFIVNYYASFNKDVGATASVDISLRVNPRPDVQPTVFIIKNRRGIISSGTSFFTHQFQPYFKIPGPAIIKIQGTGSANDLDASAGFDFVLVDN